MKQMRRKAWLTERAWSVFFGVLLILQIFMWVGVNLYFQHVNDHDAAKVMYHTIRMWEEKTLVIPGWKYMTTAEWDCSALPALLIYGMTGNILLSFAVANILHVLCFCWILLKLHQHLGLPRRFACITISAILLPFGFGMLDYSNMLFYGAAQYIYKTTLPLWMLEILTAPKGSWRKMGWRLQLLAFGGMALLTAASSGLYVFLCGLIPLTACCALFMLRGDDGRQVERVAGCVTAVLLTLVGYVLQKALGLSTYADQMNLVTLQGFMPKLALNFTNLLDLVGALPQQEISLYTFGGVMYVARLVFLICILCLGLQGIRGWYADKEIKTDDERSEKLCFASAALSGIFVWNLFVQQITISSARYHLIGYVPLMIAAGIAFAINTEKCKALSRCVRLACAAAALIVLMAGCWRSIYASAGNYYKDYYDELSQIAQEQEADSIVFINDSASAEIARVFDLDRIYASYFTANRSLMNYDAYDYYDDRSTLSDRHLLIGGELGGLSDLPKYLQNEYRKIGEVFGDTVYLAETCWLDGTAGPMLRRIAEDYPYTQGYFFETDMNERGVFSKGAERIVMKSPDFCPCPDAVKVTVYYRLNNGETGAWLDVNISGETPLHITMDPEKQQAEFEVAAGKAFSFDCGLSEETELYMERIVFDWL